MSSSEVTQRVCRHCGTTVPAANFCGYCGADFNRPAEDRSSLLRPSVFAAAPAERVLLPMVTSTLFPQLPRVNRNPFRIAMMVMLTGVVVLAVLRVHGLLVTLVALGVPVLFVLYLWQADILRDIPIRAFVIAAATGGALGVGWASFAGSLIARSYGISTAAGFVLQALIGVGLLISIGGAILMVVPAVVVRMIGFRIRLTTRESLDGFAIGALGALSFTAAATTTRLAPQFVTGIIGKIPRLRLLIEAVLYGVTVPLIAAAAGGLIGIVLWFRPGKRAADHPGVVRMALVVFTLMVVAIYTAIWVIDASKLPKWPQLVLHLVITVAALLAARFCLQLALLHEQPDQFTRQPLLCVHCDRVVPDMPFCPACGAAARASSRSSRRRRREYPPVKV